MELIEESTVIQNDIARVPQGYLPSLRVLSG